MTVPEPFDAIVLAGGRGSRLGGVDKAEIRIGDRRLVDRALDAARAGGASRLIAVGPPHVGGRADYTVREEPEFSGPLAALESALPLVSAGWILLLSCDLAFPERAVSELTGSGVFASPAADANTDGALLIDAEGRRQWLAGAYRSGAIRAVLASGGRAAGRSMRAALGRLRLREIPVGDGVTDDIDTEEQLARVRSILREDQ